jgi:hypothetical protein
VGENTSPATSGINAYQPVFVGALVRRRKMNYLSPQAVKILNYLATKGYITQLYASSEFSVDRLASRVYELRQAGIPIKKVMKKSYSGKRYAQYYIDGAESASSNFRG